MATSSITRAGLYARISTRDKGQDVGNQLFQLREFAIKQGWTVVGEFVDQESGSTPDRPQFQAMFQAASRRKLDVLLFWSLDRLSREGVLETLQYLNRLTLTASAGDPSRSSTSIPVAPSVMPSSRS